MTISSAPQGTDWADIVDALHALSNTITARTHYAEAHPAIRRADDVASETFTRLLERLPELVIALIEGELVVCERPFPDLRDRLHVLSDAMVRHGIECIVFHHGLTRNECSHLARSLASAADAPGRIREKAQAELFHVLLRFVELREVARGHAAGTSAVHFVPQVAQMLRDAAQALAEGRALDTAAITALAKEIFDCCSLRTFVLTQRCWSRSASEAASHATNVAMMAGAMALEAHLPEPLCIDLTAAALLHDVGQLLLPAEIAGLPEPLVDEQARPLFRNHTFAGASAMLASGAPPLWVAAALEHHRGVDGGGYPVLEATTPPGELVRLIAIANFFDRKRTLLEGRQDTPEEVLQQALALENRYFGRSTVERFIQALGVYPPGTTVELSDRQPALVLAANRNDPWRPRVMLLRGPKNGTRADLTELNPTTGQYQLSVVRAIPPPLFVLDDVRVDTNPSVASEKAASADVANEPSEASLLLDGLISPPIQPERALVTSPPAAPNTQHSQPPRPQSVLPQAIPIRRGSSMAPPLLVREAAKEVGSVSLGAVPQRTGAVPASLDHRGGFILTFIDGVSTVEDIIDASGLPQDDVLGILQDLVASGTIALP